MQAPACAQGQWATTLPPPLGTLPAPRALLWALIFSKSPSHLCSYATAYGETLTIAHFPYYTFKDR